MQTLLILLFVLLSTCFVLNYFNHLIHENKNKNED